MRYILHQAGLKDVKKGENVEILQSSLAEMVVLFNQKQIDAAIVPEPWGSQLEKKIKANVLLDSKDIWKKGKYPITELIVHQQFAKEHPEVVEKFVQAHVICVVILKKLNRQPIVN